MKDFKELRVWQRAVDLALLVYGLTENFPADERFGLASQLRRSAVSISSNIAEGHLRSTQKDFRQFLSIVRGSCAELETQSIIAYRLGFISKADYERLMEGVHALAKMNSALLGKINLQTAKPRSR